MTAPAAPQTSTASDPARAPRVAYIMSRFPKLTETFVLYEILALEQSGFGIEIFPLLREHQSVEHPEAAALVERANYRPFLSAAIARANLQFLFRKPRAYLGMLRETLAGTFPSPNLFAGALGILPKSVLFAAEMQRRGVQHVHAHFATHPALAALIVHRLTGIPYSFTAHGSDLHVRRRMLDRKVAAAAWVVTISRYNAAIIDGECGAAARGKVHVVHCGVDPHVFRPRPARPRGTRLQILCVASFEAVKGHRYLIEACRNLAARGFEFDCHLVGDGPGRAAVEAQIAAGGLGARIRLHGPQPRAVVAELVAAADVFVLPSVPTPSGKREGIPVVLMEAMASELPVVSSRLSGIPELVDDGRTGILVEPRDVAGIEAALESIAADPDAAVAMGRAGRAKVLEEFDLRRNTAALADLLRGSTRVSSEARGVVR